MPCFFRSNIISIFFFFTEIVYSSYLLLIINLIILYFLTALNLNCVCENHSVYKGRYYKNDSKLYTKKLKQTLR